jgi:hypothetical protein
MRASSTFWPTNWCTTSPVWVRWNSCSRTTAIADIMVNGPHRTFVEKGGKVTLANIHFRDRRI